MSSLESWAFICLMGSFLFLSLSMTFFTDRGAIIVSFIAVLLAALSVGLSLYGESAQ
jgi:hypothetical protein